MKFRTLLFSMSSLVLASTSIATAGTIDCANSSWNAGTGVVSLRITGLAPGQKVIASVYNDNTCTVRKSVQTDAAGGDGVVVVAIDTGATAAAGDKIVISDPACAILEAGGTINCSTTCPACPSGACCINTNAECVEISAGECASLRGIDHGAGSTCAEVFVNGHCIPAVSEWGLLGMTLLVLAAGTVVARRRRIVVEQ